MASKVEGSGLLELKPLLKGKGCKSPDETGTLHYLEAAHILEKGRSNDRLESESASGGPQMRDPSHIQLYRLVHSRTFFSVDLFACLVLLALTFVEEPATFKWNVRFHSGIELAVLFTIGGLWMARYRWLGSKTFIRQTRSVVKGIALIVLIVEAIVVIARQRAHFRITRILRPIFLLDNHFIRSVRRYLRQVLRSVPPALKIVLLLALSILFFSVMGFFLFSTTDPTNFGDLMSTLRSLYYLSTASEFPDLMMTTYSKNRWSAVFFIVYISIVLYFIINLMTAVVYAAFTIQEKEKIKKLFFHRRKAARLAYQTLQNHGPVTFHHFHQLIKFLDPSKSYRDVHLMFCSLDVSANGKISRNEFDGIYDVWSLRWAIRSEPTPNGRGETIYRIVSSKYFQWAIYGVIVVDSMLLIYIAARGTMQMSIWTVLSMSVPFMIAYTLDVVLKMIGLGSVQYFRSGWNIFDFVVTAATYVGLILEVADPTDSNLVLLITARNVRLFKWSKSYKDIFGAVFILSQRLVCATVVCLIYCYCYAIVGMEVFGHYQLENCCKNTSVESKFKSDSDERYYLISFQNLASSFVTLFVLTVGSNWDNVMDGHAYAVSKWSRIYFMTFHFTTLLLLSIVVASALDIFLCRITYKQKIGKEDERHQFEREVSLSKAEFYRIVQHEEADQSIKGKWKRLVRQQTNWNQEDHVTFVGRKPRNTKHFLLTVLYKEEIDQWIEDSSGTFEEDVEEAKESDLDD